MSRQIENNTVKNKNKTFKTKIMKNYSNTFQYKIEQNIKAIEQENLEPECRIKALYIAIETGVLEMNNWLKTYKFCDEREEIYFFKHIRPQIVSKLLFYKTLLRWESKIPIQDLDKKQFYIQKHSKIEQQLNGLHYIDQYLSTNNSFNDTNYFTRQYNLSALSIYTEEYFNYDSRLCTPQCIAVTKLLNYKMLIAYLKSEFESNTKASSNSFQRLKWNFSKQDLFELIFALHYSKAIGEGDTSLAKTIHPFEIIFDIKLKAEVYKRWLNQKKRKKELTPFLQNITTILQNTIKIAKDKS